MAPEGESADGAAGPPPSPDNRTSEASGDEGLWASIIDDVAVSGLGMDSVLQRLARRASATLGATSAIFLRTADEQLVPRAFWDDDPVRLEVVRHLFDRGPSGMDSGMLGEVARGSEPRLVSPIPSGMGSPAGSPYAGYLESGGLNSFLMVPMLADDRVFGLLAVGRHGDQPPLDDSVMQVASRFAMVAAQVVRVTNLVHRGRIMGVALDAMRDAVIAVDSQALVTFWNVGAERLYGIQADEALGRPVTDFLNSRPLEAPDSPIDHDEVAGEVRSRGGWKSRLVQPRRDGSSIVVDSLVSQVINEGKPAGAVIVNRDVSDVVRIESALLRQQLLAQAALDASPMLTAVLDDEGVVLAASRGWSDRIGADLGIGAQLQQVVDTMLVRDSDRREMVGDFVAVASGDVPRTHSDYEVETQETDRVFSVHINHVPEVGAAITIADVTDRASRERELSFTATHDLVTRLPNRSVLIDRMSHALNRAARSGTRVGLLFCDLDEFKALNDKYGHGTGDDVLEFFGARLVESCRSSDTVARIGGATSSRS